MSADPDPLSRSVAYMLVCLDGVRTEHLRRLTPCSKWDLAALLLHLDDSLVTLGALPVTAAAPDAEPHLASIEGALDARAALGSVRLRLADLQGDVPGAGASPILAEGLEPPLRLPATTVAAVAALECAVHGWDIAQTCDTRAPIPGPLSADLLEVAHRLAPEHIRAGLFAAPVPVTSEATASDRLVAYLGRRPFIAAALARRSAR